MLSDLAAGLRWNASLGAKFLRVVPFSTLAIVLLTLVSQISMLLASFLPLKVVIMLGSESIPRYFPAFLAALERDVLIGVLSAGTVGFFFGHLVAERMIEGTTGYATSRLLAKSHKMVLFENQEGLAASSYQRYSRSLAGGVFIGLALLGLGWFYPGMSLFMLGYFFFMLLLLWQSARYSTSIRERLESKLAPFMSVLGTVGFFVAFGFLVIDFIFFNPPGVIVALVSFLLVRQAMQRAAGMTGDLVSLYKQKPRLNALFFHGQVFQPLQAEIKNSLWSLLMPKSREAWVSEVLVTLVDGKPEKLESHWHQLGSPNVTGLRVARGGQQFLLKLYEPNRSSFALHEASLMASRVEGLPAPEWIGTIPVDKFHCLGYCLESGHIPDLRSVKQLSHQLRSELLAAELKPVEMGRYTRSRAMLWQRVDLGMIERVQLAVSTPAQQQGFDVLLAQLPELHQFLSALPLAIFNPEMSRDAIWIPSGEDGQSSKAVLLNWGRWSLEPVGAGWPEAEKDLSSLGSALEIAALKRPRLAEVTVEQAELAALAFALERECNRQRYNQALELIPRILDRMAVLQGFGSTRTTETINGG